MPNASDGSAAARSAVTPRVAAATACLGVLIFWAGLSIAAHRYPTEYDWRYMTVSSLLHADQDPAGHLWATGGLVLCALCGFFWVSVAARGWHDIGAGDRAAGIRALQLGYFFMACAAGLPRSVLPVPKGHELLSILAFIGVWSGMICLISQTLQRALLRRTDSASRRVRWLAVVLTGGVVLPIALAGIAQAYVFFELPDLPWVNLSWRQRGVPVYISFAFWEWITCAVLSAYVVILALSRQAVHARRKVADGV